MIDEFVEVMGKGVMKDLILDRGFLDGKGIAKAKSEYGIDVTIGVKRNMNVFEDALGLVNLPEVQWESYTQERKPPVPFTRHYTDAPRPEHIEKREAARQRTLDEPRAAGERPPVKEREQIMMTRIKDLTTWSSCSVPLDLVVCRDAHDELLDEAWGILSTARDELQAVPAVKRYHLRIHIEERHRHLKCFWDLAEFTSPSFALVANQIIFTALTYSLLQQQILRQARKALNKVTKKRLLEELASAPTYITVFTDQYYGMFHNLEYTDMALSVSEEARKKLRVLIKKKKREMRLAFLEDPSP